MSTIRAIVVDPDSVGKLAFRDVEPPIPTPSEALVRVHAISLNLGEVRDATQAGAGWRPGWDLAGVIEQSAADCSGPPSGTRVVGLLGTSGSWAEQIAVPTAVLAPLPDAVTFAQAATLPVAGLTALYALERGGFLLNRKVLITGASGGVGHFACQLARQAGASVVAVVRQEKHAAGVKALGVQEVVLGEDVAAAGRFGPYHLILDVLGGQSLAALLTFLAPGGLCINIGAADNPQVTLQVRYHSVFTSGFNLYGLFLGSEVQRRFGAVKELQALAQMVADGRLQPRIDAETSWTEIANVAQRLLARQIAGKAVLHVAS